MGQSLDSFPSQLRPVQSAAGTKSVADNDDDDDDDNAECFDALGPVSGPSRISQPTTTVGPVTWRTDLLATEQFWKGWYTGLSDLFLGA